VKKAIIIALAVVAVIIGGALLKGGKTNAPAAAPTKHITGSTKTGVTLVEYGDFQCPGCGGFYPILNEIKPKYNEFITFQFVNFPLTQIHPNSLSAHRAAQAASNQNKFWEMHDLLYTNQDIWKSSTNVQRDFEGYAQQLGLDIAKYKIDFASAETNSIIQADIKTGQDLKITGTPTFFLDGKRIEDNNTISTAEKFSAVIEAEIEAKTGKKPDTGVVPTINSSATPSKTQ
jgi:protein-disulfide isomerase